jgi:hypothetical protein
VLVGAALALLAGASTARAAAYGPPPGRVFAGVTGGVKTTDYMSFAALTGKRPPVWQLFLTWDLSAHAPQYVRARLQFAAQNNVRLMFHLTTANSSGREMISPASVAAGAGDAYFLWLNRELGAANRISYVRIFAEMNQASNVYSAYGGGGHRGASHSTARFRQAFRRAALILRGGPVATINARLRGLGMAPVRTTAAALPAPPVALLWCPHVVSSPGNSGNSANAYNPGGAYFDWVCTDIYSGGAPFGALSRAYSGFASSSNRDLIARTAASGKPFAIGEWGFDTFSDSPGFVSGIFSWVRSRPRADMVLYNQGNRPGSRLRLQRYPRSAARLRAILANPVYVPASP